MQLLFEQLYKRDEAAVTTDLGSYVQALCGNLVNFHGLAGRNIGIETAIEPLLIEIDRAVPLGLIVNEFIVNSFKPGFPGGEGTVSVMLHPLEEIGRASCRERVCQYAKISGVAVS